MKSVFSVFGSCSGELLMPKEISIQVKETIIRLENKINLAERQRQYYDGLEWFGTSLKRKYSTEKGTDAGN